MIAEGERILKLQKERLARIKAERMSATSNPPTLAPLAALAFPAQRAFIDDAAQRKFAICTRRSAKSYSMGLMLVATALKHPGGVGLYCAITREEAKRIVWRPILMAIEEQIHAGMRFGEAALEVEFPNRSRIYLVGADANSSEKRKLKGQKFRLVCIDEAQDIVNGLDDLVHDVLEPAVAEHHGQIVLGGTPGEIRAGYFWRMTSGQVPGWSRHSWSWRDNPHVSAEMERFLKAKLASDPGFVSTSAYKRNWLGEWVADEAHLCYSGFGPHAVIPCEPRDMTGWTMVLGVDLGYNDDSAFVVSAYGPHDPTLYVLSAEKAPGMDLTDVAQKTRSLQDRRGIGLVVADGANKQGLAELENRHGLSLLPSEKTDKATFMDLLSDDLRRGRVKLVGPATAQLQTELSELIWDKRALERLVRREDPQLANHLCWIAGTLISTSVGPRPIESLLVGDMVWTRAGLRPVAAVGSTGRKMVVTRLFGGSVLTGTPEHPVWTENRGWVSLLTVCASDTLLYGGVECQDEWASTGRLSVSSGEVRRGEDGPAHLVPRTVSISGAVGSCFTVRSGSPSEGSSLTGRTFITKMEIPATTRSRTWSASLRETISRLTCILRNVKGRLGNQFSLPSLLLQNGIGPRLGALGIGPMGSLSLKPSLSWTTSAKYAENRTEVEDLPRYTARDVRDAMGPPTSETCVPVYALSVEGEHEYFANGVLVKNCDALLYSHRWTSPYLATAAAEEPLPPGEDGDARAEEIYQQARREREELEMFG